MHETRLLPTDKRVQLMATCLCDAFFADAAMASVQVLEHLGIAVDFPEDQTCCGQPAFNAGDWPAARKVARHAARVFAADLPLVVPSGSCAAMLFHGAQLAFENEPDREAIAGLGRKTWELADFIVNGLGVKTWPGRFDARIAFHRSCHARGTETGPSALTLLKSIPGVEVVAFDEWEQCCGFGGTFSVALPAISAAMGELKLRHIRAAQPDLIVSIDMSCMMHLGGLAGRQGRPVKTMHLAQVLREALRNGGLLDAPAN